jgi:radical SAM superfamily enzyme YgiQ (UPF0313 family)
MRILLIQPTKARATMGGEDIHLYEPLALEYLAAPVAEQHDVRILDLRLESDLEGVFEAFRPDVVGITAYTVHVNTANDLCCKVKKWKPDALTVVGGHHATVRPEDFVSPCVDLIVRGEGVHTFKEIIERHERGMGFECVPGVALAEKGDGSNAKPSVLTDLDDSPFPLRKLTATYRKDYYSEWMKPLASLRTSKGCPFRCNFCALWKISGGKYLTRKPENIIRELGEIEEDFVFFADDESLVDASRMKRLAQQIKEAGIRKRYFLYGRSDTIARNPELLEAWREIGLDRVFVGLEFFQEDDLRYIRKGSTIRDNETAVKILHDLDINIYASFILRPEYDREDFAALKRFCRRLDLNFASFAVLTPLPGTDLYDEVKDQLIIHNYDYFDFIHTLLPTRLPLNDFYAEYYKLYREAVSPVKGLSLLTKFPLLQIPGMFLKWERWMRRLKRLDRDYGDMPPNERAWAASAP